MTVGELLGLAIDRLNHAKIENGTRDARTILRYMLDSEAALLDPETAIPSEIGGAFLAKIDQRCTGQPVAQIIGKREFWGREFKVSKDTLDPRPESELLIELSLNLKAPQSILDLGTGTGCLLLTLLAEIPDCLGQGVDLSEAALRIAEQNASHLGLSERASFVKSNWLQHVSGKFDLIVCNPPYISEIEMESLQKDVVNWEPHRALTPGGDGLSVYRLLCKDLRHYLHPRGAAIFEIGETQSDKVCGYFREAGFTDVQSVKDINGKDRAILVRQDC